MRKILVAVCMLLCTGASAQGCLYEAEDSIFIVKLLDEARRTDAPESRELFFARRFIGRPYVAHTLEVADRESLIVNTRQLDCTTLVETVAALTLCADARRYTFADYKAALQQLRYRRGVLDGYTSRLHYFSDWIADKAAMGIVTEVQRPNPPFTAVQRLSLCYMSTHPKAYKALAAEPGLVPEIAAQEKALTGKTWRYIPKSGVRNTRLMRSTVKDGDIIAITCNKKGLDIAHLGFAVWRADGLHLLNASMLHKRVVEEPMTLYRYLSKHPSHTGIRIIRINKK